MNEFFWSKNNFFQKSSSTGTDGGEGHFWKILLNKDEDKIFKKFTQQDRENFLEKSRFGGGVKKNPI